MKGLECSEVNYSVILQNKDVRIDSAFCIGIPKKNKNLQYKKIGDCLLKSYYGISISMNENKQGFPIYRMNEMHNMLCDSDVSKYADISFEEFKKFELKDRDVLFNRTNSYEFVGRTGIYYKNDNGDRTFASYLVCFNPDESIILPEYLTAFLNSKQGVWDIKRRARQSINQTNVNPEEVKQIEIPLLSMDIQNIIKESFEKANYLLTQSQSFYHSAEQLLLKSLGLENWQPKNEATTIKKYSDYEKSGRLDAEYYQPKYEELLQKLNKYDLQELNTIVSFKKSIEPGSECYQTEGVPFVRVSDVSKDGISDTDIYLDDSEFNVSNLMPRKDTILFSKDGSVGIAYKLDRDYRCITSGALLHLNVVNEDYLADYLTLVLNSVVVQLQAERDVSGAIIQHWKPSEIEKVLIPKIDKSIQKDIADKVQESFRLRRESKELLERAKRAVEIAIEEGEEKALYWLEYNKNLPYPEKEIELQMVAERTE